MTSPHAIEGDWHPGVIPANVTLGEGAYVETSYAFHRFQSQLSDAVSLGRGASMYRQTVLDVGKNGRVEIGAFSMLNSLWIVCDRAVTIGSHCLLSWNVVIMDTRRAPTDKASRGRLLRQAIAAGFHWPHEPVPAEPVVVGDNVWIGFDSVVLPGVTIGTGSVIGARSVVADDIPPYSVAVGNPARVVSRLAEPEDACHA
jgi:acetyltransferase-like isoleucine patch superfamily enzyme